MQLGPEQKNEAERIMTETKCRRRFACYNCGQPDASLIKSAGIENFAQCTGKNPTRCEYSLPFGYGHFCRCPLKLYLLKCLGD